MAIAARNEVELLRSLGHDVQVVTGKTPNTPDLPGVERFDCRGNGSVWRPARGEIRRLRAFVRAGRWDLVILAGWQNWASDVVCDALAPAPATRLILRSHGVSTDTRLGSGPAAWARYAGWRLYRHRRIPAVLRRLSALVPLAGLPDRDRFLDVRLARDLRVPVYPIPNLSPSFGEEAVRAEPPAARDAGWFLCVGNFSPNKNELGVLEAYERAAVPDVPLVFVAQTENRYGRRLRRLAQAQSLDNVRFVLDPDNRELARLYRGALAVVVASRTECQPLAILDALSLGVPFVTTRVGDAAQHAGGCVVDSLQEMSVVLRRLAVRPEERERLALDAKRHYEATLSRQQVVARWLGLLTSVRANESPHERELTAP